MKPRRLPQITRCRVRRLPSGFSRPTAASRFKSSNGKIICCTHWKSSRSDRAAAVVAGLCVELLNLNDCSLFSAETKYWNSHHFVDLTSTFLERVCVCACGFFGGFSTPLPPPPCKQPLKYALAWAAPLRRARCLQARRQNKGRLTEGKMLGGNGLHRSTVARVGRTYR